jgi:hypothetical protein
LRAIFDDSKKDLPTFSLLHRADVVKCAFKGGIAKICGLNHKIAYEWRQRVFATVDGYQDCIILRDRVWIDETYINDTDLAHAFGQARKRGLSKQKLCIAVAIDACKNALVVGHGKPSRVSGTACAYTSPRGQPWSGTWRKSYRSPVRAVKGVHEAYRAHVSDPQYLECMAVVNKLCLWLKRYLWHFAGMDPKRLQNYLNR